MSATRGRKTDDDDLPEDAPAWHRHDWSTQEIDFVCEYMRTGDEIRAYRHAFNVIREKGETAWMNAGPKARRLLDKPWMSGYIGELQAKLRARMKLDTASIMEELAKLGFANMSDFVVLQEDGTPQFDISGISYEQSAAISEMTIETYMDGKGDAARPVKAVKVKLAPKIGALELMGKHLKMWTDVIKNEGDTELADEIRAARARRRGNREGDDSGDDGEAGASDGGREADRDRPDASDAGEDGARPD
jgi:phage terminase small subunit